MRTMYCKFVTSHTLVLLALTGNPLATIREIAEATQLTERHVHFIIDALTADGHIRAERLGRRKRYVVELGAPLRQDAAGTSPSGTWSAPSSRPPRLPTSRLYPAGAEPRQSRIPGGAAPGRAPTDERRATP